MFCPVVLSPPTWSNSAELGADDILKNFEHVLSDRKVSWTVGVPTSYQCLSERQAQNKRWLRTAESLLYVSNKDLEEFTRLSCIKSTLIRYTQAWGVFTSAGWFWASFSGRNLDGERLFLECLWKCWTEVTCADWISERSQPKKAILALLLRFCIGMQLLYLSTARSATWSYPMKLQDKAFQQELKGHWTYFKLDWQERILNYSR